MKKQKCRKHPTLEVKLPIYKNGVPLENGKCSVCENEKTLKIIADVAGCV